jgi:hypothetical protein
MRIKQITSFGRATDDVVEIFVVWNRDEFGALLNYVRVARQLFDTMARIMVKSRIVTANLSYPSLDLLFHTIYEVTPNRREYCIAMMIYYTKCFAQNIDSIDDVLKFSRFVEEVGENLITSFYLPVAEAFEKLCWKDYYKRCALLLLLCLINKFLNFRSTFRQYLMELMDSENLAPVFEGNRLLMVLSLDTCLVHPGNKAIFNHPVGALPLEDDQYEHPDSGNPYCCYEWENFDPSKCNELMQYLL